MSTGGLILPDVSPCTCMKSYPEAAEKTKAKMRRVCFMLVLNLMGSCVPSLVYILFLVYRYWHITITIKTRVLRPNQSQNHKSTCHICLPLVTIKEKITLYCLSIKYRVRYFYSCIALKGGEKATERPKSRNVYSEL